MHVQNLVLDNCLSTIKHETLYYPNRIRQILERLRKDMSYEEEVRQVEAIGELIAYYKDVFTILSSCAARQLEEVTFRRTRVQADELVDSAVRHFQRMIKKRPGNLQLKVDVRPLELIGDIVLLRFMLES